MKPVPPPDTETAPRRIRVLFIHDTSRNGGPGRTILYILKFLDSRRIERTVIIPREDLVSGRIREAGAAENIVIEPDIVENLIEPLSRPMRRDDFDAALPLRLWRGVANIVRATRAVMRLAAYVRRERFDLIFCNGTTANFLGGAMARMTDTAVVWHVLYPSVAPPIRALHDWLARSPNVRRIICVSAATKQQFAQCADKVLGVSTALDIGEFSATAQRPRLREELNIAADALIFGAHGRVLPRKGFMELIQAARRVVDSLDPRERARCRFVILGDTPEDIRPDHLAECRAAARSLGLDDVVTFTGFRADVRPYVGDFDVAVVPSVYEDPMPRAVMEAMAMSKPVIAFARGGIDEMISNDVEGMLVEGRPPDIEALATACLRYFRDPDLRVRHGRAARSRIERQFDARQHAARLQELMLQLAAPAQDGVEPRPRAGGSSNLAEQLGDEKFES